MLLARVCMSTSTTLRFLSTYFCISPMYSSSSPFSIILNQCAGSRGRLQSNLYITGQSYWRLYHCKL